MTKESTPEPSLDDILKDSFAHEISHGVPFELLKILYLQDKIRGYHPITNQKLDRHANNEGINPVSE